MNIGLDPNVLLDARVHVQLSPWLNETQRASMLHAADSTLRMEPSHPAFVPSYTNRQILVFWRKFLAAAAPRYEQLQSGHGLGKTPAAPGPAAPGAAAAEALQTVIRSVDAESDQPLRTTPPESRRAPDAAPLARVRRMAASAPLYLRFRVDAVRDAYAAMDRWLRSDRSGEPRDVSGRAAQSWNEIPATLADAGAFGARDHNAAALREPVALLRPAATLPSKPRVIPLFNEAMESSPAPIRSETTVAGNPGAIAASAVNLDAPRPSFISKTSLALTAAAFLVLTALPMINPAFAGATQIVFSRDMSAWKYLPLVVSALTFGLYEFFHPVNIPVEKKGIHYVRNISLTIVNGLVLSVIPLFATFVLSDYPHSLLHVLHVGGWINAGLSFLFLDFVNWAVHRFAHRNSFMWRFHRVHHNDIDVDVSTGFRVHLGEILINFIPKIAAILLWGPTFIALAIYEASVQANSMFHHANIRLPGWLETPLGWILAAPHLHRLHHSADPKEYNSNYGEVLSVWDRLFGTYVTRPNPEGMKFGMPDQYPEPKDIGFFKTWTAPFFTPKSLAASPRIEDANGLNRTSVAEIVKPKTVEDIAQALKRARDLKLKVSIAGTRNSMGGQAFFKNALALDMTGFNGMSLNESDKTLNVQSGALWSDVQALAGSRELSVDVMQAYNQLSVGGALGVNAQGGNPNSGPVASTVLSLRLMLWDGSIVNASRLENTELFRLVLGGYGLFGVILDAKLRLRDDELYKRETRELDFSAFPEYFQRRYGGKPDQGYAYNLLSFAPGDLLKKIVIMSYARIPADRAAIAKTEKSRWHAISNRIGIAILRLLFGWARTARGKKAAWAFVRWAAAHGPPQATRNQVMNISSPVLAKNPDSVLILQEYFLPKERLPQFLDDLRPVIERYQGELNLLNQARIADDGAVLHFLRRIGLAPQKYRADFVNLALRHVRKDDDAFLSYAAGQDVFGLVINVIASRAPEVQSLVGRFTREAIDAASKHGGRFYLPYQLAYTQKQLSDAYPNIDEFFALKRKYDPTELFTNYFYEKYGKAANAPPAEDGQGAAGPAAIPDAVSAAQPAGVPVDHSAAVSPTLRSDTLRSDPPRAAGPFWYQLNEMRKDLLGFLAKAVNAPDAKAAGIVRISPLPFRKIYMITNPDMIRHILGTDALKFRKSWETRQILKPFFGKSVVTTEGQEHQEIRNELKDAFKPQAAHEHVPEIIDSVERHISHWRPGETLDIVEEMHRLALHIFVRSYFGIEEGPVGERVQRALRAFTRALADRFVSVPLPQWIPTRGNRKQARVMREVDAALYALIDDRMAHPSAKPTLLDTLIAAEPMTPERRRFIKDQLAVLFFAGHETSANLMSWTLHLISAHPDVEAKLRQELTEKLGDRPASLTNLNELSYLKMVIKEVMRLYPPGWLIDRTPIEDVVLGGYRIPKGSVTDIPIFLLHRSAQYFDKPDDFIPERFAEKPSAADAASKGAYIPFGTGSHYCLGHVFAADSIQAMAALILRRWKLSRQPGPPPVPAPVGSLGIKDGLKMTLEPAPSIVSPEAPQTTHERSH